METITFVIAIIGCVTGVTSLLIKLFEYFRTVPNLKIELDETRYSFFFKTLKDANYRITSEYGAVISLKISNCSVHPVTISSISVYVDDPSVSSQHQDIENKIPPFRIINGKVLNLPVTSPIRVPRSLGPYDVILESANFPFFDNIVEYAGTESEINLVITVGTSNKIFREDISLRYFEHVVAQRSLPKP